MTAPCPIFGFQVELELDPRVTPREAEELWQEFVALVQQRGLEADGGRGIRWWTYRLHGESSQASDVDRSAIRDWASAHPGIVTVRIGDLFDVQGAA
jgi:uncharacterized protein YggL (DUF469 family)